MPEKPLLHPRTDLLVKSYVRRPAHALLLHGLPGVGLQTIASYLTRRINEQAIVEHIAPDDKGTISIDIIRTLYTLTRSKHDVAMVIIIDEAEHMSSAAQNALLKLLEEPTTQTYFIITSHYPQQLLTTILSRVQRIAVQPVSHDATIQFLAHVEDAATQRQLLFLASGLPAELTRLQDATYMDQKSKYMRDAKQFVTGTQYERLTLVNQYATQRETSKAFIDATIQLLSFMLLERQQVGVVDQLTLCEMVRSRIFQNAHCKTQLTYLASQF